MDVSLLRDVVDLRRRAKEALTSLEASKDDAASKPPKRQKLVDGDSDNRSLYYWLLLEGVSNLQDPSLLLEGMQERASGSNVEDDPPSCRTCDAKGTEEEKEGVCATLSADAEAAVLATAKEEDLVAASQGPAHSNQVPAPRAREVRRLSSFRDASEDDISTLPQLCTLFQEYMVGLGMKDGTINGYVSQLLRIFALDGKAPAEMATSEYKHAVSHTYEDVVGNHCQAAALAKFADFWECRSSLASTSDADRAPSEETTKHAQRWIPKAPGSQKRHTFVGPDRTIVGDDSAEARALHDLPEGWQRIHSNKGRSLGWASPGGRLYINKPELDQRLGRARPEKLTLPPAKLTPEKSGLTSSTRRGRPTREATDVEEEAKDIDSTRPSLQEVLSVPLEDGQAVTAEDRTLLPRVLATYREWIGQSGERKQSTCEHYTLYVFKIFCQSGRRLQALTEADFVQEVTNCEDNRKSHGNMSGALKAFGAFWKAVGGYEGTFLEADRSVLNTTLQVRPALVDQSKSCGCEEQGHLCQRRAQRCITCGSDVRCYKHGQHSTEACREIFWATHSADGKRVKTVKDFFRPRG